MIDINQVSDFSVQIDIKATVYNEKVVSKSLYWFSGEFSVNDFSKLGDSFYVVLELINKSAGKIDAEQVKCRLCQNLIDFKNRDIINDETKTIRELIMVKAFSPTDEFDGTSF